MDNLSPAINNTEEKMFASIRGSTHTAKRGNIHSCQEIERLIIRLALYT